MEIRTATLEDLDQISALYEDLLFFRAHLQPRYYQLPDDTTTFPKSAIESDDADILVAENGGKIVGFLNIFVRETPPYQSIVPRKYAYISDMDIAVDIRGRGVGRALLDAAKEWAKKRHIDTLELHVIAGSSDALRMYEKVGFETVSDTMRLPLD